jgi:uncharacterized cupin superfamily protein
MKRPNFIKNYKDLIEPDGWSYPGSTEVFSLGAPVGKKLGLEKIGVHIETIPKGRRTSWPHAESHEEEFAYVISGKPSVWIDGEVYDLIAGDFVALPAGTGISHTFINNDDEDAVLLVGGESSKKENQVTYPLHPDYNAIIKKDGRLWETAPERQSGSHDGKPSELENQSSKQS